MVLFEKPSKKKGGFIFLSHSHDDIEKVRKIRNKLEEDGFEPLCFYLKCLSDDNEIEDLIKREIDAREWFVFLNSENSQKSRWVTLEREYINKTNKKKILTIDLDNPKSIADVIDKISQNLRIHISYSPKDMTLASRIYNKLTEKDYLVFFPPFDIPVRSDWASTITKSIDNASADGAILVLITPQSIDSIALARELTLAIKSKGTVIPIVVDNAEFNNNELQNQLQQYNKYILSANPTEEELDNLVDAIGNAILNK